MLDTKKTPCRSVRANNNTGQYQPSFVQHGLGCLCLGFTPV